MAHWKTERPIRSQEDANEARQSPHRHTGPHLVTGDARAVYRHARESFRAEASSQGEPGVDSFLHTEMIFLVWTAMRQPTRLETNSSLETTTATMNQRRSRRRRMLTPRVRPSTQRPALSACGTCVEQKPQQAPPQRDHDRAQQAWQQGVQRPDIDYCARTFPRRCGIYGCKTGHQLSVNTGVQTCR